MCICGPDQVDPVSEVQHKDFGPGLHRLHKQLHGPVTETLQVLQGIDLIFE